MQISGNTWFKPDLIRIDRSGRDNNYPASDNEENQETEEGGNPIPQRTASEDARIQELQQADREVRAHEAAHLAAGGGVVTGGANFSYTKGPDGKMYATAGEVPIDASEESTPEATIQKARQIAAAAMAPADPSPTDYRVAASAVVMEMRARMEIIKELMELIEGGKAYQASSTDHLRHDRLSA